MVKDNKIPFEIAVRLQGFINLGIQKEQLMSVVVQAADQAKPGTDEWVRALLTSADRIAEDTQDNEADWLNLSFWYFLARFPHCFNESMKSAYAKHKDAYLKACAFSPYPIEKVKIPLAGLEFDTYLRKPQQGKDPFALAIIWGGIDIWKSDLQIHQIGNLLLEKGIAVLAVDSPGTGDCPIPISAFAETWFTSILEQMKNRSDIDSNKIACYGLSFGGYWATKLALQHPWLAGVVNVGGPVHSTFDADWIKRLPDATYDTLAYACGFNDPTNAFLAYCPELSLSKQSLLPAKENAPLLVINGAKDNLVQIAEIEYLSKQVTNIDTLVFSEDRHVASKNWQLHSQFAVNWLTEKLKLRCY
ncbi:2,6-dihydropseudooxynicotine hydrolase [Legionella massiliensis]|uniref:2,6-dihydropseudooxynicotine hydrolase n=1 Tax=Legionella massiliensis TaxID=1034943 RepID=A0A078L120_9GAMM|nr:alpha/beta hydrolase [Legionella massiliensis]CDZ77758.1 2,6-dihydropseudooxynicotine hydrolase [Legionella massiliensis]CEE13496.1 2,6-dihydropseudooxynicotine hydrolase [Legionella massiliensis]